MSILSKGTTFATGTQVSASSLNNLVDAATFASGAVDGVTLSINSGGALTIKDYGVTSTKLSSGAPTWDGSNVTAPNGFIVNGDAALNGGLTVANGQLVGSSLGVGTTLSVGTTTTLGGNVTMPDTSSIIASGSAGLTTGLRTSGSGPNNIQFGFRNDSSGVFLLVTVDGANAYKIPLVGA
jgi:hypothetical protein